MSHESYKAPSLDAGSPSAPGRETFSPPSLDDPNSSTAISFNAAQGRSNFPYGGSATSPSGGTGGVDTSGYSGPVTDGTEETTTQYLCGECDNSVVLKPSDPIRCKECGYRVIYKKRTNRMIQFEAR